MSVLPKSLSVVRTQALSAISPLRPATDEEVIQNPRIRWADRIHTTSPLPPYYLVYFLLIELLQFPDLGPDEKVAWTVPMAFEGRLFAIQHRKLGLGVFALERQDANTNAERIVVLVHASVRQAQQYFDWKAEMAVQASLLNVVNHSEELHERFRCFRDRYHKLMTEAAARKDEHHLETERISDNQTAASHHSPAFDLAREAEHHAVAAIEAFYSWTEHIFVHFAILAGECCTGVEVADLAKADWSAKYKHAVGTSDPKSKNFFDELLGLRRQIRNFTAHGSFGKNGEAFHFHSAAGAVPVLLAAKKGKATHYSLFRYDTFSEGNALLLLDAFVEYLWDIRRPALTYLHKSGLPAILTLASDGTYSAAVRSQDRMEELIRTLCMDFDRAANMDW